MKKTALYIFILICTTLTALEIDFDFEDYYYTDLNRLHSDFLYPDSPGLPAIPFESRLVMLPYGTVVKDITWEASSDEYSLAFDIPPIPAKATFTEGSFSYPRVEEIYNSNSFYPSAPYQIQGKYRKNGVDFISLRVFPFQYNPFTNRILQYKKIHIALSFEDNQEIANAQARMLLNNSKLEQAVSSLTVFNPETLSSYYNHQQSFPDVRTSLVSETEPYSYIIITGSSFYSEWNSFIAQKVSNGVSVNIYTTSDISTNYAGRDTAERVRNFILDAYTTWSGTETPLEYVLLGGDSALVPYRNVRVEAYYNGSWHHNTVPSDNYFGGLDGDWDNDGDNIFGEGDISLDPIATGSVGDEADYFQEVYVGRASADTVEKLQHWLSKTMAYENSLIDAQYLKQAGFIGEYLGSGIYGDDFQDEITTFVPEFYQTKLYAGDGTFTKQGIANLINSGVNFISHLGHGGSSNVFSFYAGDVDTLLTNTDYCFIYSQACHTAKFNSTDSIGEALLTDEHGAFAYIGNTHYGFYSTFMNQGPSQFCNREFFDAIQNEGIEEISRANADSKEDIIGMVGTAGSLRQVYMELTLFGDPILKLHKDVATLTAEQTLSAEIILHLSDFTPDATAYTASYNVYERDNLSITIPVSNITVSGNDIILTLNTDIPAGYPYNINISAMSGISGTLTRQVSMLSNIRELSVITEEVWSADNNPYYIYKYLLIKNRLTIEPGVELRINDDVGIIVYGDGVLLAEGTSDSPIVLSGYDYNPSNEGTWEDILFYRDISSLENSLSHCIIMNASTGVRVDSTAVVNIDNCKILNSPQYGIYSYYGEQTIRNTIIGYEAISPSTHGIYLEGCDSVIDNLTYVGNNSADISFINSAITLRNSIVRGSGGNIISTGSNLSIDYTNIEGSYPGSGNINSDPLFTNTAAYDYSLQNSSPCIDAGFLYLTPDPDNTLPDMGALYYHHPIAFEAQFTQGDAPLSIQFTNQSGGSPDLIRWDFNNDGNWDDTGDIGLFDTTMSGSYDVLMRIEKGTWFDTLLKEDYIVISDNATLGVTNPSISASETEVLLQWSADPDADYYLIYYAIAPNTPFQYLGYSETNLFLTGSISEKSFYLIKKVTISE